MSSKSQAPLSLAGTADIPARKSIEDEVYEYLRALIVSGLRPGAPLRLDEIARHLEVSTMPVRGALARLSAENLVTHVGRRKAVVVAPVSIDDLRDIQAIRCGLEGYAARSGAQVMEAADVDEMARSFERLAVAVSGCEPLAIQVYLEAQFASHRRCFLAAGHPRLLQAIEQWRRAAERYIRLAADVESMLAKDLEFEEKFLRACQSRDGACAEEAIREMLLWVVAEFEIWLEDQPAELRSDTDGRFSKHGA